MQLAAGGLSTRRRRKYRLHEKRLATIKEKYEAGDYTLSEFLKAHRHWVSLWLFVFLSLINVAMHVQLLSFKINFLNFRRNGTYVIFVRRNEIRQNGIRRNGLTPVARCAVGYIQLLVCAVATLPQYLGRSWSTCTTIPSFTSLQCFCHSGWSTHTVYCGL